MDRLSAVVALLLAALLASGPGCTGKQEGDVQLSRVAAVKARPGALDPRSWCDTYGLADAAPLYEPLDVEPARASGTVPSLPQGRWVWLNFWATWCAPCRREMPMLEGWRKQLNREGAPVDLWYVSLDDSGPDLRRFLERNPSVAPDPSLRLTREGQLEPWLRRWGVQGASVIPVHVLVDPHRRVRCIHLGETREGDYPVVKALFE
ncbi:MAG: TlpA disulfide reductase family protein [Candidatus Latescibacterota bacterium]